MADRWKSRIRTVEAMAALCGARLTVAALPFSRWRNSLGGLPDSRGKGVSSEARRLAAHVQWAAQRLPFETKCLPRAMALSWLLRSRRIAHSVIFAVRPVELRGSDDQLHSWLEAEGETIIGDLPGPWVETLRIGDEPIEFETS